MVFDGIMETFFGSVISPVDFAARFLLLVLFFDSIFGLINNLVNASRK